MLARQGEKFTKPVDSEVTCLVDSAAHLGKKIRTMVDSECTVWSTHLADFRVLSQLCSTRACQPHWHPRSSGGVSILSERGGTFQHA